MQSTRDTHKSTVGCRLNLASSLLVGLFSKHSNELWWSSKDQRMTKGSSSTPHSAHSNNLSSMRRRRRLSRGASNMQPPSVSFLNSLSRARRERDRHTSMKVVWMQLKRVRENTQRTLSFSCIELARNWQRSSNLAYCVRLFVCFVCTLIARWSLRVCLVRS